MLEGFTYVKTAVFLDGDEVAINITSDTFELEIYDSDNVLVDALTIGSGLTIVPTNKLNIAVGPPVTTTAGTYTGTLIWTRTSNGAIVPILNFSFLVE